RVLFRSVRQGLDPDGRTPRRALPPEERGDGVGPPPPAPGHPLDPAARHGESRRRGPAERRRPEADSALVLPPLGLVRRSALRRVVRSGDDGPMTYGTPSRPGTILSVSIALLALFGGPAVIGAALGARGEAAAPTPRLFAASDACLACHNGLVTPSGEDVSIGSQWRASIMANSARDPYWQAAVRREIMDFPMA